MDPMSHFEEHFSHENFDSDEQTKRKRESIRSQSRNETEYCVTIGTNDEQGERDLQNSSLASVPSNDGPYVMAEKRWVNYDGYQNPLELQSISSRLTAARPSLELSLLSLSKRKANEVTGNEGMAKHSEEEVEKNGKHSDLHESQLKRARLSLT